MGKNEYTCRLSDRARPPDCENHGWEGRLAAVVSQPRKVPVTCDGTTVSLLGNNNGSVKENVDIFAYNFKNTREPSGKQDRMASKIEALIYLVAFKSQRNAGGTMCKQLAHRSLKHHTWRRQTP